ncbi:MAG: hypothetical protein HQM10_15965 [Candidatus Riflebacteria bacterium]|nr:hypothetical protein [Candidatus Riflebacteria bacterium]
MAHENGKNCNFDADLLAKWHRKAISTLGIMNEHQKIIVAGHDLQKDLLPVVDLGQMMHLFIKRVVPSKNVSDMLKCLVVSCNYPDIRVWPIGTVALAASSGASCAASVSAGNLAVDSLIFGHRSLIETNNFFISIQNEIEKGRELGEILSALLKQKTTVYGYGRPLFKSDERVPVLIREAKRNNLSEGYWFKLSLYIESELQSQKGLGMNFSGISAAILKDLGYNGEEMVAFSTFLPIINFIGVYHEHRNSSTPIFPLSCNDIDYCGPEIQDNQEVSK